MHRIVTGTAIAPPWIINHHIIVDTSTLVSSAHRCTFNFCPRGLDGVVFLLRTALSHVEGVSMTRQRV